jgi:hypothetical protein
MACEADLAAGTILPTLLLLRLVFPEDKRYPNDFMSGFFHEGGGDGRVHPATHPNNNQFLARHESYFLALP